MSVVVLAFALGAIPVPSSPIHSLHIPPAYSMPKLAVRCLVAKKEVPGLTLRAWVEGKCPK